jgi:hypothetical protein
MCGTIIEWLEDISGCHVGGDYNIIRSAICEELLGIWRPGSNAHNTEVGREGIDDHAYREERQDVLLSMRYFVPMELRGIVRAVAVVDGMDVDEDGDGNGDGDEEDDDDVLEDVEDLEDVDMIASGAGNINKVGGGLDEGGGGGEELGDQNFAIARPGRRFFELFRGPFRKPPYSTDTPCSCWTRTMPRSSATLDRSACGI